MCSTGLHVMDENTEVRVDGTEGDILPQKHCFHTSTSSLTQLLV